MSWLQTWSWAFMWLEHFNGLQFPAKKNGLVELGGNRVCLLLGYVVHQVYKRDIPSSIRVGFVRPSMLGIQGDSMFSRQHPIETYSSAGLDRTSAHWKGEQWVWWNAQHHLAARKDRKGQSSRDLLWSSLDYLRIYCAPQLPTGPSQSQLLLKHIISSRWFKESLT